MKPCNTCPFLTDSTNFGCREWVIDVARLYVHGKTEAHTCHKTDPNADGYVKGDGEKKCDGIKMIGINDKTGVHIHKSVPKSFMDFFERYAIKMRIMGDL